MSTNRLRNSLLTGVAGLVLMNTVQAATPVWTFAQVSGYPSSITVSTTGAATVKYTVTNQSHKTHTLQMRPIQGIASSGCTLPLGYQQQCTLTLSVNGSGLKGDVLGGPVLCDQGNPNQCYQPSQANSLAIRLTQAPPIQQYTVTSTAGSNGSVSPSGAQTVNSGATLTFTATPGSGYGVAQWLLDGTPVQTGGTIYQLSNITANHTVNVTFGTVTLTPSVSTLALSINCLPSSSCATTKNAALTGNPRQITIQNTGSANATNVSVNTQGLPLGTTVSTNTCSGTLNASGSCVITLTPGSIASSDSSSAACTSGTQPVASTVTVTADGGLSSQVNAYVLGYGCQYQGGFLYSVDDSYTDYPVSVSIGGKVAALTDQAPAYPNGIVWDSSSGCITSQYNNCYTTSADSFTNGTNLSTPAPGGNTYLIYQTLTTNHNEQVNSYAAGLCTATIATYSDWYLPAICEMGPDSGNNICSTTNVEQNMVDNLSFLLASSAPCTTPSGCLAGFYWSSTEYSPLPTEIAWNQYFASGGGSDQSFGVKGYFPLGVRCSRALTL